MDATKVLTPSEGFIESNQDPFQELLSFIDFAEVDKLTLGFIEINFPPEIDILVDCLRQHFSDEEIQFEVFSFPDPGLQFLRDVLKEEISQRNIDPNKKTVLIVRDLEYSIGVYGSYPPILSDLNYVRNAYKLYIPHPILFVLPDFSITRVVKFAPDFWDWRSGFFRFKTTQETRESIENQTLNSEQNVGNLKIVEKQEKVDKLHRLLMEYRPTGQQVKEENIKKYSDILFELGNVHESQGDYNHARQYLEDALEFATRKDDLKLKLRSIGSLGWCDYRQGKYQQAIISSNQSLTIAREIDYRDGIANSLNNLGLIYKSQGEYSEAIQYYQQSLQIQQEIGDRYGIAYSVNNLGLVYESQGKYSQAIQYHQESLVIKREIGDRYGIASSLNNLGLVYGFQGKYSEAIQYHQQSLAIKREIGDRYGIANSVNNLGLVYGFQGKYSEAIQYHQQSLAIRQKIGDRDGIASSLSNLGDVYQSQGEYSQAIKYYQQARERFKEINLYHRVSQIDKILNSLTEQPYISRLKAPPIGDEPSSKPDWYYRSLSIPQRKQKKSLWQSLVQFIKKWRSRQCRKIKHNFRRKRRY